MKKIIVGLVAFLMVLPNFASAASVAELQNQINALLAQVALLQQQLSQQAISNGTSWCHNFNTDLQIGNSGSEVIALQTALEKEGLQIKGGWNPNIFDELTASAVSAFQEKYRSEILTPAGLSSPTGYVGSRTRNKLNALYKCVSTSPISTITTRPIQVEPPTPVVTPAKPDITISGVSCNPSSPKISESIICSVTVYNNSAVNITKPFAVNIQGTAVTVNAPLNAWSSKTVRPTIGFSFSSAGNHILNFPVDIWNAIEESNENNNTYSMNIDIGGVSEPIATTGTLSFSQNSFNFNYTKGGPVPSPQFLTFTNTSNINVIFTLKESYTSGWLSTSYTTIPLVATPGTPTGLSASVDPVRLQTPGTYHTNIVVTGNFTGSPLSIPVNLKVEEAPVVAPTASLTGGTTNLSQGSLLNVKVGDIINYRWNSIGADSAYSSYNVYPAYTTTSNCGGLIGGGPFTWVANSLNGSTSATVEPCQAGRSYFIKYTAVNSQARGGVSTDSVLTINVPSTTTGAVGLTSSSNLNQIANVLMSASAILENMLKSLR